MNFQNTGFMVFLQRLLLMMGVLVIACHQSTFALAQDKAQSHEGYADEKNQRPIRSQAELREEIKQLNRTIQRDQRKIEQLRDKAKIPPKVKKKMNAQIKKVRDNADVIYQNESDLDLKIAEEAKREMKSENFCCTKGASVLTELNTKYADDRKKAVKKDKAELKRDVDAYKDAHVRAYDKETAGKIRRLKLKIARLKIERFRASIERRVQRFTGRKSRGVSP